MRSTSIPGPVAPQPYSHYKKPEVSPAAKAKPISDPKPVTPYQNQYPEMGNLVGMGYGLPKTPTKNPVGPGQRLKQQLRPKLSGTFRGADLPPTPTENLIQALNSSDANNIPYEVVDARPSHHTSPLLETGIYATMPGVTGTVSNIVKAPFGGGVGWRGALSGKGLGASYGVTPGMGFGRGAMTGLRTAARGVPLWNAVFGTGLLGLDEYGISRAQTEGVNRLLQRQPNASPEMQNRVSEQIAALRRGVVGEGLLNSYNDSSLLVKPLQAFLMGTDPNALKQLANSSTLMRTKAQMSITDGVARRLQAVRNALIKKRYPEINQFMSATDTSNSIRDKIFSWVGDDSETQEATFENFTDEDWNKYDSLVERLGRSEGEIARLTPVVTEINNSYNDRAVQILQDQAYDQLAARNPNDQFEPLSFYRNAISNLQQEIGVNQDRGEDTSELEAALQEVTNNLNSKLEAARSVDLGTSTAIARVLSQNDFEGQAGEGFHGAFTSWPGFGFTGGLDVLGFNTVPNQQARSDVDRELIGSALAHGQLPSEYAQLLRDTKGLNIQDHSNLVSRALDRVVGNSGIYLDQVPIDIDKLPPHLQEVHRERAAERRKDTLREATRTAKRDQKEYIRNNHRDNPQQQQQNLLTGQPSN